MEWTYLFVVLHKFGFGSQFISWIQLLYNSPQASVYTNNVVSDYFTLTRGTRQGCPLSPLVFALMIPLSMALCSLPHFQGISPFGINLKLSLYADDLLLYVSDTITIVSHIISLQKRFGLISGYKINISKSECYPVNS